MSPSDPRHSLPGPSFPAGALAGRRFPSAELSRVVGTALDEDLGPGGDPTSRGLADRLLAAELVARAPGVVSGLPAVDRTTGGVAQRLGTGPVACELRVADGDRVEAGTVLARLTGSAVTLLAAERTLLNIVGRLSGVATMTAAHVAAVAGTGAVIRDTRKTTPGLRALEKYAVLCGGGRNHRLGLYDALLVKDNHVAAAGSLTAAVQTARAAAPDLPLEVEADTLAQVAEALASGCDLVLLDNMDPATLREAVALCRGRARTEASGGVALATVAEIAATGVDFIAVGALTHSAPVLDVALDWTGPLD